MARKPRRPRTDRDLDRQIAPLVAAICHVVGDDFAAVDQARENGRTILRAVLAGAGDGHHRLTVATQFGSAGIVADVNGDTAQMDASSPALVAWMHLAAAEATGTGAGITLHSTDEDGESVRGWLMAPDGGISPMGEAEIFSAYCTDAETGEPLPPERGVAYRAAFPLDV